MNYSTHGGLTQCPTLKASAHDSYDYSCFYYCSSHQHHSSQVSSTSFLDHNNSLSTFSLSNHPVIRYSIVRLTFSVHTACHIAPAQEGQIVCLGAVYPLHSGSPSLACSYSVPIHLALKNHLQLNYNFR